MPKPLREITRVHRDAKDCGTRYLCFVCRQATDGTDCIAYSGLNILAHEGACALVANRESEGYYQSQTYRTQTKDDVLTRLYRLRSQEGA